MKKVALNSLFATTIMVSGCAANSGIAQSTNGGCNTTMSTAVGTLIGAAAGYAISKNSGNSSAQNNRAIALGALAGGASGYTACIAFNETIRKKSDAQVKQEYAQKYGALPAQTKIEQYTSNIDSGRTAHSGEKVYVSSNVYVVEGQREPILTIKETIAIKSENGEMLGKMGVKDMKQADGNSGDFGNSFTLTVPDAKGNYIIETAVLVNGKQVEKRSNPISFI
ncbi:hypothetical protein [Acinetobacter sedimenti]|uniref:hypothetical protein n=1 Tax=Acinetobacter sedimenti TaxID=2919922 RepID=UPI00237BB55F|nr:hypothetical protein [Acinetobacter sedimenti]